MTGSNEYINEYIGPTHACAGENCRGAEHHPELASYEHACPLCAEYDLAKHKPESVSFTDWTGRMHTHAYA